MVRPAITRRDLLRGVGALTATCLAGCVDLRERIQVAVVWSDRELERFREVVKRYERESGRAVEVIGAGDNLNAFVRARHRAGHPPDVTVLPQPGFVADYAREDWIDPVSDEVANRFEPFWTDLVTIDGRVWGAWLKAAHKSLLWHRDPLPVSEGGEPHAVPRSWDDLVALVERMAHERGPAPLAIGAADGWVLTDWLENLLIARAPDLYDNLARGEACWGAAEVRSAFRDLALVWGVPHAFPGGGRRALLTQFEESVIQVVAAGEAAMLIQGDFALPVADDFRPAGTEDEYGVVGFPFPAGDVPTEPPAVDTPLLVGGDVAVVAKGSAAGHELVDWLTASPTPFLSWMRAGGYLSPAEVCDAAGDAAGAEVCAENYPSRSRFVIEDFYRSSDRLRFDLSDRLPGAFGAPGGSWGILQDFFADVTASTPDLDDAIDTAVRRLDEAAGGTRCSA
jgi:alpha-glucoside transport system substrate-binding protein